MRNAVRAVVAFALVAMLVSTSAIAAVEITKENKEEKREFNGWGNYDILENVYPVYKPMDIRDNFYVGNMDDIYRSAADAPDAKEALYRLTVDDTSGSSTANIVGIMLEYLRNVPAGSGFYTKVSNLDSVTDGKDAIMPYVTKIDSVSTLEDLTKLVRENTALLSSAFCTAKISTETTGAKVNVAIGEGTTSFNNGEIMITDEKRAQNIALFGYMLNKVGFDDGKIDAYKTDLREIEELLKSKTVSVETFEGNYTQLSSEFKILGDCLNAYSAKGSAVFSVPGKAWMTALDGYYKDSAKIGCVKALAMYCLLTDAAYYIDSTTHAFLTENYGTAYDTKTVLCRDMFDKDKPMSMYAAKYFCEGYLTASTVTSVKNTVKSVMDAAREYYNSLSWFSQGTKDNINLKFDNMKCEIAVPTSAQWLQYSYDAMSSVGASAPLYDYIIKLRQCQESIFVEQCELNKTDIYRDVLPQTYNAEYGLMTNTITLYPGMIAFDAGDFSTVSQERLLSRFCSTVGHEITHGFDDEGSNHDETGATKDGWLFKGNDKITFDSRTEKLIAYVSSHDYYKKDGVTYKLDGKKTAGEVIADMGGLAIIEHMASKKTGFDYEMFYKEYARYKFSVMTFESFKEYINDAHPTYMFRVNMALQQSQKFMDTFGIKQGDGMYLSPGDRAAVWA